MSWLRVRTPVLEESCLQDGFGVGLGDVELGGDLLVGEVVEDLVEDAAFVGGVDGVDGGALGRGFGGGGEKLDKLNGRATRTSPCFWDIKLAAVQERE
jgi:hypothetical protein